MTVPHLMNCPHTDSGWCNECVAELGNENWRQRDEIAALRKDAERYRWLRDNRAAVAYDQRRCETRPRVELDADTWIRRGTLDEAVDAIMASRVLGAA